MERRGVRSDGGQCAGCGYLACGLSKLEKPLPALGCQQEQWGPSPSTMAGDGSGVGAGLGHTHTTPKHSSSSCCGPPKLSPHCPGSTPLSVTPRPGTSCFCRHGGSWLSKTSWDGLRIPSLPSSWSPCATHAALQPITMAKMSWKEALGSPQHEGTNPGAQPCPSLSWGTNDSGFSLTPHWLMSLSLPVRSHVPIPSNQLWKPPCWAQTRVRAPSAP